MIGKEQAERTNAAPETMTIPAAAKRLGVGRNQAYQAAARGEIPVIRIGKRWLVPTGALDRMLSGKTT